MKKKLIILSGICVVIMAIILLVLLFLKHEVDYKTAEKNTTQTTMEKAIGSKPDKTREENGMTVNTYNYSIYMDYTGKMDYYYLEDKLMMSRWETECDGKKEMNEAYDSICNTVSKDLGEGEEDENQKCTIWSTARKDVTIGCNISQDGKYTVYMVENQK